MAGYQIKIVIEDTHPPVWRRVVIPEHMSFRSLHEVIQILFDWEDTHLHEFSFSGRYNDFRITTSGEADGYDYLDEDTVEVDELLKMHHWIRYIYDFGDEWRHKITLEKEIPDYSEEGVRFLKYKGNNFCEDSGGSYYSRSFSAFDPQDVTERLEQYVPLLADVYDEEGDFTSPTDDELDNSYNDFSNDIDRAVHKEKIISREEGEDLKNIARLMTETAKKAHRREGGFAEDFLSVINAMEEYSRKKGIFSSVISDMFLKDSADKEALQRLMKKEKREPSEIAKRVNNCTAEENGMIVISCHLFMGEMILNGVVRTDIFTLLAANAFHAVW